LPRGPGAAVQGDELDRHQCGSGRPGVLEGTPTSAEGCAPVSYRSILVNIDIDASPSPIMKLAVDLARKFGARLIGVCAADVTPPVVSPDGMVFDSELLLAERDDIEKRLAELQLQFHRVVGGSVEIKWRGAVGNSTHFVVEQARAVDLVV